MGRRSYRLRACWGWSTSLRKVVDGLTARAQDGRDMSDRDAFGREKGEDALAGMGWSSAGAPSAPTPAPVPTPAQPAPQALSAGDLPPTGPAPAWAPGPRRGSVRRRRRRVS